MTDKNPPKMGTKWDLRAQKSVLLVWTTVFDSAELKKLSRGNWGYQGQSIIYNLSFSE